MPPPSMRAETMSRSAESPAGTAIFWPRIRQPPAVGVAVVASSESDHPVPGSAEAKVNTIRPAQTSGRMFARCCGVPAAVTSPAPSTAVAKYGSKARARPHDSITTDNSSPPIPAPPYSSAIDSPSSPISAYCAQVSRLHPSSDSISAARAPGS